MSTASEHERIEAYVVLRDQMHLEDFRDLSRGAAAVHTILWMGNAVIFSAESAVIDALAALPGRPGAHDRAALSSLPS